MTKAVTEATVKKVASLAKLKLSDEEVSYYRDKLSNVLDHFQQLDEIAGDLQDDSQVDEAVPQYSERDDEIIASFWLDEALASVDGSFQVPKIID